MVSRKPDDFLIDLSFYPLVEKKRGCYVLIDGSTDEVLYVGKSVKLRERLSQYVIRNFIRDTRNPSAKKIIDLHPWIEVQIYYEQNCPGLEHELIKELKPKYNVRLE